MLPIIERIEPILFVIILLVTYTQVHRFKRVVPRRYTWVRRLHLFLPLLAIAIAINYGFFLWGGLESPAFYVFEVLALVSLTAIISALIFELRFGRPASNLTVLAIGAHPDDIEFGCGATLMRYREEGHATHGLVLTVGERGTEGSASQPPRVREAHGGARVLGLGSLTVLDFPDTHLRDHYKEVKKAIEELVVELEPDIILTHNQHDVHSDHNAVFDATLEAARGAQSILCYENPSTPTSFKPSYFVDVSQYMEDKIRALMRHKTQTHKSYFSRKVVTHIAGFRGSQARVSYAEGFEVVRFIDQQAENMTERESPAEPASELRLVGTNGQ